MRKIGLVLLVLLVLVGYIGCGKVIKISGKEMVVGSPKELKEINMGKSTRKGNKAKMVPTVTNSKIWFQAHRGGLREAPENTMAAFRYVWELGGIPEADIRTTKDNIIFCLHDSTLRRTTNAPAAVGEANVSTLMLEEVKAWDAGATFSPDFAGEKIPALAEVFAEMQDQPENHVYLDLKQVDLERLGSLIKEYKVGKQVIFCHNRQESLIAFRSITPGVRTMLWICGKPEEIKSQFESAHQSGFKGLDQVQLHLRNTTTVKGETIYLLETKFLQYAIDKTRASDVDLEVLPFEFDDASLVYLLDLGIRWFATDYPNRFARSVRAWQANH